MRVAVIGPGAMGILYGAKLARCADVVLVGNNEQHIKEINLHGITIKRDDETEHINVKAALNGQCDGPVDVVIMFTKAYLTEEALSENKNIIGPDTLLLTLQNGAGHEAILGKFAPDKNVLIGTTAQGSYRENGYTIVNTGLGDTAFGPIASDLCDRDRLNGLKELFIEAGFPCEVSDNIRQTVWNKLMINASSSVLSGVLQVKQGYIAENSDAFEMCKELLSDLCNAANAEGLCFDLKEQTDRLEKHLKNAPDGLTSIYTDLKNGRKTEVDYISGEVVRVAKKNNIKAPYQEMIIHMVHAMENRT